MAVIRDIFNRIRGRRPQSRMDEELRVAAMEGKQDRIEALLREGAAPDGADGRGCTALHGAAQWGHPGIVKLLLDKGADPNVAESGGLAGTALTRAAVNGHFDIVKMLVDAKADVNATDYEKRTGLHLAIQTGREDIALYLIDAGTAVDTQSRMGDTPLLDAIRRDMYGVALALAERDANPNIRDADGLTIREVVAGRNWPDVLAAIDNPGVAKRRAEEQERLAREAFDAAISNAPVLQNDIAVSRPLVLKPLP